MPKKRQPGRRKPGATGRPPIERLRETWTAAREALISAERRMEKQARGLLKRNKVGTLDAALLLKGLRTRAERERRKAVAGLEARMQALQAHLQRERKAFGRTARDTVQSTLAALNIPSREEIAELTRRVEKLSRRLDSRKR